MRITFVMAGGFNLSGGDRVIAIYAERLAKRGHTVLAVASAAPGPTWREQVKSLLSGRGLLPTRPVIMQNHFDATIVPHRRLESSRPVAASDLPDADVVIATWWETCEWVKKLPPSKGVPVHFVQHYEAFDYLPKDRVNAALALPFHKITISKWLVELLRDKFGFKDPSLVLNSVETTQFNGPPRERNSTPRVGMLYASVPWKGTDVALRAIEIARKEFPDLQVSSFGAGEAEVNPALPLPPGSTYEYRPAQTRIPEIYRSCDVWLCGSRAEGFHLPPLEAMACRTPVVSTAVGGPIDIIHNDVNGHVVPIGDSDALAAALLKVLRLPPAGWKAMSDACYDTAIRYTWDDATVLFEKALERATGIHTTAR
jgi:glycosyltransferase involved in cell wall biosynthesis